MPPFLGEESADIFLVGAFVGRKTGVAVNAVSAFLGIDRAFICRYSPLWALNQSRSLCVAKVFKKSKTPAKSGISVLLTISFLFISVMRFLLFPYQHQPVAHGQKQVLNFRVFLHGLVEGTYRKRVFVVA